MTTVVEEGHHVRAQVRSRLAGMAIVGDIIKSLVQGGEIVGVVNWVGKTYRRRMPSSSPSSSDDGGGDGGGNGGGDIVLLGSSTAAPWP